MTSARPLFSVVTAVYNVEAFLPEFIASIEAQRFDLSRVEVIAVNDGSTDGSLALLERWAARRPGLVTVISKENGGQASARNLGIEHATGEWITFSDPDDMLDRDFFATADGFASEHPGVEILGARPIVLDEARGRRAEHPRARQYDAGSREVDLRREPNVFPGGTILCLLRLDRVLAEGVRFDERLRPVLEDVHFVARYLLTLPVPLVGIVPEMRYIYRRRRTNDSTMQRAWSHPGRFTAVLEHGHLDLLRRARAPDGSIAPWVQHLVIYDLSWYLEEAERTESRIQIPPELAPTFQALFCEVIGQLDPAVIRHHTAHALKPRWADLLAHGGRRETWHAATIDQTKVDRAMRLQRIALRFDGATPRTEILVDGTPVSIVDAKIRTYAYFGRVFMREQISWVRTGSRLEVRVDGVAVPMRRGGRPGPGAGGGPRAPRRSSSVGRVRGFVSRRMRARPMSPRGRKEGLRLAGAPLRLLARTPLFARYRRAWVLIDRADDAGDNAERLFHFLRSERPHVNAWFAVDRGTPAWDRMRRADGHRLVARGSLRWTFLMLNCAWLVSSHADKTIVEPRQILSIIRRRSWKIAFLQHGVTQADISTWLNKRDFEFVATSTDAETASFVDDETPYIYTAKEVSTTGMPRYDRLIRKGGLVPVDARDLLLIAPTWRRWLVVADDQGPTRAIDGSIRGSEYLQSWRAVLESRRISDAAAAAGWRLAFMPHPNFQSLLASISVPRDVQVLSFADVDPQDVYARTALVVTDYSSVAFDVAALDRPVVYFQFDRAAFFGGGHIGKPGYFDYERDGFGPVTTTLAATEEAILAAIAGGPRPTPAYQARIDAAFPNRDGQACARVVDAIEERSRPYRSGAGPRTTSPAG